MMLFHTCKRFLTDGTVSITGTGVEQNKKLWAMSTKQHHDHSFKVIVTIRFLKFGLIAINDNLISSIQRLISHNPFGMH